MRQCISKDARPREGGGGVDWGLSHQLEKGTSATENTDPKEDIVFFGLSLKIFNCVCC